MADEKDILEELIDARMASKKELDKLDVQRGNRAITGFSKNRPVTSSMMPDSEMTRRMANTPSLDDLAQKPGSRIASKTESSVLSKIGSKIGAKGLGKSAAGLAGLPLLLASEAADASEVGESAVDDDVMIGEAQARNNYKNSPAREDKLNAMGQPIPESNNQDYFKELRAIKDKRSNIVSDRMEESGDDEIKEMLDMKDEARDHSERGMSQVDKENVASEHRLKRRRELGLE
jgi:Skp family chaperone for outer membrane proteins